VIGREVGYGSGYAFAAAFKREAGAAPGAWCAAEQAPSRRSIGSAATRQEYAS
jgi:AraC-like DNA-binding protein